MSSARENNEFVLLWGKMAGKHSHCAHLNLITVQSHMAKRKKPILRSFKALDSITNVKIWYFEPLLKGASVSSEPNKLQSHMRDL